MLDTLYIFLSAAVPMQIAQIRARGGLDASDDAETDKIASEIANQGDALLYRGKSGEARYLVTRLAKALAILAFQPGGVTLGEHHWEAT